MKLGCKFKNFCGQPTSDNEFVVFGKVTEGWEVIKAEFIQFIFAEKTSRKILR